MCIGKCIWGRAGVSPTRRDSTSSSGCHIPTTCGGFTPMLPRENEEPCSRPCARARPTQAFTAGSYFEAGVLDHDLPLMRGEAVIERNPDLRELTARYNRAALTFIEEQRTKPSFSTRAQHAARAVVCFGPFCGQVARGSMAMCDGARLERRPILDG